MRRLHVWMEGHLAGWFEETDKGITFTYAHDAPAFPISMSLPREGGWLRRSPERFLENLLPDETLDRIAMAQRIGASSADMFDLLDLCDTAGGLVFSLSPDLPVSEATGPHLASDDEIGAVIRTMMVAPHELWRQSDPRIRFSLAGSQQKFALADTSEGWAWSDALHPSTHILKPPSEQIPDVGAIEAASMRLADLAGMDVPQSGILAFKGLRTYVVSRFDRSIDENGKVMRIHVEDMMQALGLPSAEKYGVKARSIVALLNRTDSTKELSYQWVSQLALNVSLSNADAHAKNYSLLLRPSGVSLSPMYDVITTTYWDWVDRRLPMNIGGATGAAQLTPHHWRSFAVDNDLDEERVVRIARSVSGDILAHASEAYQDLPAVMRDKLLEQLKIANSRIEPIEG